MEWDVGGGSGGKEMLGLGKGPGRKGKCGRKGQCWGGVGGSAIEGAVGGWRLGVGWGGDLR